MTTSTPAERPGNPCDRWKSVRRLLAVRTDNLGDVLMTTPALAALRDSIPNVEITLLGGPGADSLRPHLPTVDHIMAARVPWVRHEDGLPSSEDLFLLKRLTEHEFDAAVIFTVCTQSALPAATLCRLAGIPLRLAHSRENPYELLTDWVPEQDLDISNARHEVQRQLDLVRRVGCRTTDDRLRFRFSEADVLQLDGLLSSDQRTGSMVVHVGASAPSRRWSAERFGEAASEISRRTGLAVIFTGSEGEIPLIEAAQNAMATPSLSLAGRLSLGELGALIARSAVVLTNNSGPAHLAAAVGTPVVDLYALTNPQHTPWRVQSRVLYQDVSCRNCLKSRCPEGHHRCLEGVPTERAVEAALELLGEAADSDRASRKRMVAA